ncbi:MAG: efflux RND transporter permease subunit [Clostridiales bacterium]|nr:efflux RND transporter permease subunit [Clostridiales bacterium]
MEKFSVKKPFTVLVAVIAIIALGAVSLWKLKMDLLPEISLPYMIVIATYPGADPQKVESQVTIPMENALGTISGVVNVTSASNSNYCMVQMEFEDNTDLDSAMVKVSGQLNQLKDSLPDEVGTPTIMEISMDMVATMYVAVEREGYDIYQISDFTKNDVIPYISRQEGVASVSTIGLVEKSVVVSLNKKKVDDLNDKILKETDSKLKEASDKLDDAQKQLDEAQDKIKDSQSKFGDTVSKALFSKLGGNVGDMGKGIKDGTAKVVKTLRKVQDGLKDLKDPQDQGLGNLKDRADKAASDLDAAMTKQANMKANVDAAKKAYDKLADDLQSFNGDDADAYSKLLQAAGQAQADLLDAQIKYDEASDQVRKAQKKYEDAVSDLSNATIPYDAATLSARIDAIIKLLEDGSKDIDTSSVADLASSTAKIKQALLAASDLLDDIKRADPAGTLSGVVGGAADKIGSVDSLIDSIPKIISGLQTAMSGLTQGQLDAAVGYSSATYGLMAAQTQLDQAKAQYDKAKKTALDNANVDSLLSVATLSGLVYAQNFSMPAGYIDDKDDNTWLLTVGDSFESDSEIANTLLLDNEILGTIRLEDIADIVVIDNADDTYTKLNGSESIILSIFKSSASGTNDVSKNCQKAIKELEDLYPGTHFVPLMDQGDYITMIVNNIFVSIAIGAALAIIILALVLKDVKPTIVVAISIPMSLLLALVLMYFTGLELNMMTLSGLSLGIGMLVDNSVVVMENIFRLVNKGMQPARAAVQGAKQMRGSIIASTLTTVCVFLPAVFASGMVRTLLFPLALSIGYCLTSSLVIALTVVPASCSTLMKNTKPKKHPLFDKVIEGYGKSLRWCLRFKVVPLVLAVVLLGISIWSVINMGIIYLPEIASNEIEITIKTPEEMTRKESYEEADNVISHIMSVDGVRELGIMDRGSTLSFFTSASTGSSSYGTYTGNALVDENLPKAELQRITSEIEKSVASDKAEVSVSTNSMADMSMLMGGSGMSIKIYGKDTDKLYEYGKEVADILRKTEGLTEVSDGSEEGEPTLHLVIDRDKAMADGFTTAQIYAAILSKMNTSVKSTTITADGLDMTVTIKDETDPLTVENLLDIELESSMTSSSSGMGDMADMMSGSTDSGFDMDSGSSDMSDMAAMFGFGDDDDKKDDEDKEESEDKDDTEDNEEEEVVHKIGDYAVIEETKSPVSISHENLTKYITVTAQAEEGYNLTLIARELQPVIDEYNRGMDTGYSVKLEGESAEVREMVIQMVELAALALLFIYLIMVAQFQSFLSPFIILFTIPLAFTGGMFGLMISGQQLSMLSLLGFVILMGTVVNNGIVFVDYANQLRIGGLERREALVATGKTRMRPILMTALTTILAMSQLIFGSGMASQLGSGMAIVIAGGLMYATLMTLYVVPVIYDIFFRKKPLVVDVGSDIDEELDDAGDYLRTIAMTEETHGSRPGNL